MWYSAPCSQATKEPDYAEPQPRHQPSTGILVQVATPPLPTSQSRNLVCDTCFAKATFCPVPFSSCLAMSLLAHRRSSDYHRSFSHTMSGMSGRRGILSVGRSESPPLLSLACSFLLARPTWLLLCNLVSLWLDDIHGGLAIVVVVADACLLCAEPAPFRSSSHRQRFIAPVISPSTSPSSRTTPAIPASSHPGDRLGPA